MIERVITIPEQVTVRGKRVDDLLPWILSVPFALLFVLFLGIPLYRLFELSFQSETFLGHYVNIFAVGRYRNALFMSFAISILVTAVSIVLGLFMAYFLARREFTGKRLVVAIISFPISFPGVLVAWAMIVVLGRTGVLPQFLAFLSGESASTFAIVFSFWGLVAGYTYFTLPRVTMSMVSSIEKVDQNIEEAARSLGASRLQTFRHVTLPVIAPAIASAVTLAFSVCMAAFGTALLIASGVVDILPLMIFNVIMGQQDYAAGAAMAVVLTIITVSVIYGYRRKFGGSVYA
ncbi:ABC transporter permease subunit [Natrarchaeobius halalkaliphilus]|uniref:ABC transporter permease subunit n=1 Tax=Natrarchaeobius halalkaliphilus TaxID=1679091 RepID=A0A3N6P4S8_9EURY|nr:ABC transporter permease subunit [Natrarchaeobius halalkaliphilus]RQG92999.1 ABC transporter permease subunit [Natrarchaeobius halalkaliphilus]